MRTHCGGGRPQTMGKKDCGLPRSRMQQQRTEVNTVAAGKKEARAVVRGKRVSRSGVILIVFVGIVLFCFSWVVYTAIRLSITSATSDPSSYQVSNTVTPDNMASSSRLPFTINSNGTATGLFIFLHGLGDTGQGWSSMFEVMRKNHVKYIFPNAETMPVTLNYGMKMPSWFDISSLDMSGKEDEAGIKQAAEKAVVMMTSSSVHDASPQIARRRKLQQFPPTLIQSTSALHPDELLMRRLLVRALMKAEQEAASIPSERVILGGFSMGGALALYTGLTHTERLGGMVLLSTWLPLRDKFMKNQDGLSLSNQRCPIFQGHGDEDPLVQTKFGSMTHELISQSRKAALGNGNVEMTFKKYRGVGHSSSDEEMADVAEFIQERLGSS